VRAPSLQDRLRAVFCGLVNVATASTPGTSLRLASRLRYRLLMRPTPAALVLLLASPAMAANYATCILDKAPQVQSDTAAMTATQACLASYPGGIEAVKPGSGRGLTGYNSGAECAARKAAETRSEVAAYQIRRACVRLYEEPGPLGEIPLIRHAPNSLSYSDHHH